MRAKIWEAARIQTKKDRTVISQRRFILLTVAIAVSPLLWWLFLLFFPKVGCQKYDFFLFEDFEQKLYWYVFETAELLCYVAFCYIIHGWNKFHNLRKFTKWLYIYQIFRVGEYWLFHGSTPLAPFVIALILLAIDLYRSKNTH